MYHQFNTLSQQTLGRVLKVGKGSGDGASALLRGAMQSVDQGSSIVGTYNLSGDNNKSLIRAMIKAASHPDTLVIIIADECHWGAGCPVKSGKQASGPGEDAGGAPADEDQGGASGASNANHVVRSTLPLACENRTSHLEPVGFHAPAHVRQLARARAQMLVCGIFVSPRSLPGVPAPPPPSCLAVVPPSSSPTLWQLINGHKELTNPEHSNVVTLLVSATPFCLLTRDSRVPRRELWVPLSVDQGGGSSEPSSPPRRYLKDLDAPSDDEAGLSAQLSRVCLQDVHVIDWSETVRRTITQQPISAHLRCYVGSPGTEDGFWYVQTSEDQRCLGISCKTDADDGGSPVELVACDGQDALVNVRLVGSDQSYRWASVETQPGASPTLALTPDAAKASCFRVALGLGEGLIALEYVAVGPGSALGAPSSGVSYLKAVVQGPDPAHGLLQLAPVPRGDPVPVQCQFRLAHPALPGQAGSPDSPPPPATYVHQRG